LPVMWRGVLGRHHGSGFCEQTGQIIVFMRMTTHRRPREPPPSLGPPQPRSGRSSTNRSLARCRPPRSALPAVWIRTTCAPPHGHGPTRKATAAAAVTVGRSDHGPTQYKRVVKFYAHVHTSWMIWTAQQTSGIPLNQEDGPVLAPHRRITATGLSRRRIREPCHGWPPSLSSSRWVSCRKAS
jgi:hypothetical protein